MWPKSRNYQSEKSISDKSLEQKIKELFWIDISWKSLKDIKRYLNDWLTEDELNKYRDLVAKAWIIAIRENIKDRVIISVDWRDAAWKWSNISRVIKDLAIKRFWVKAFDIPTDEERFEDNWFQRYIKFFPELGKIRFFDRSWYNRSGVEAAMWFCTLEEYNYFMENVVPFELREIFEKGFKHLKIYLSVTKETQKDRLKKRNDKPRKNRKSSSIDRVAPEKRNDYTLSKFLTLSRTNHKDSPWIVLDSNEKFLSSIEIMKAMIATNARLLEIIQNDLDVDLSPNLEIRRTAQQELILMRENWDLEKASKKRWLTIDEVLNPANIEKVFDFDTEEARKLRKEEELKKKTNKPA